MMAVQKWAHGMSHYVSSLLQIAHVPSLAKQKIFWILGVDDAGNRLPCAWQWKYEEQ
jgi:hypothetical protein